MAKIVESQGASNLYEAVAAGAAERYLARTVKFELGPRLDELRPVRGAKIEGSDLAPYKPIRASDPYEAVALKAVHRSQGPVRGIL